MTSYYKIILVITNMINKLFFIFDKKNLSKTNLKKVMIKHNTIINLKEVNGYDRKNMLKT